MHPVIDVLASSDVDRLERLWKQLLVHHDRAAGHLTSLGAVRPPEESWRLRRGQYLEWLREPLTSVLVAHDGDFIAGYAVVRVVHAPGSWEWGDQVGVLETLVVDDEARGTGVGQALLGTARERLAALGIQIMKISVIAGNEGAVRFYRREGAVDFVRTLVMPVSD
ncbi:ribosomal protein S18 acetylase RimI-like enzyme [Streptomyces sp. SAI-135]|jgi:ribosomal protein S18 acetylase RimI-like enzyme|uniref:GNAT family N-acetyltransferase n=1 Tax=unclassified Streptomyces TaxID=2593676 RepID=UPI002473B82C|nr:MULTISPECIES: GNAT family N-acetyltransferase [unclassified Streptomyces]MDH6522567.1 ribosomal protein S18 acetylase RimI-like enzyme [Streptomyces sp. SAI-090]MDH6554190.1 ribosomal protein S18 acetylase RimI-like enzyme [Streptomyces sp. SAI-041]MDH6573452.1 ribosomal protein S18 acetylase RimI-like enzyme [Streptomyces sp. SAI-117]MDH6581811.1 ribosomal protein S18 acetylase RimI-like enzyme [Streptomyces sp. SAI-133]MDH6613814.1 ribosomal protein S18 acetylase RimI-like enzyme [Strepto